MKLYSQILGENQSQPLIIMHGVFGMGDNWQTLGRQWAEQYQVHLLDMRNHGRSPHSDAFSYAIMTQDLGDYMQQQELSQAIILGHSMGGKVAMQFAVEHPEQVQKLIVADIAPKPYQPHHGVIIEGLQSLDFSRIGSRREAEAQLAQTIEHRGIRQFLLKSLYWPEKGRLAWRFNVPVLAREVAKTGGYLPAQALYQGDTLFLRGEKSDYILDEDWSEILKHFPRGELCTIAKAGHWLHAEQPQAFKEAVDRFLANEG